MPDDPPAWVQQRFLERFDAWVALEQPSPELRRFVLQWIFACVEDPLRGAKRVRGFDDLWVARVPGAVHEDGRVVVCSFSVRRLRLAPGAHRGMSG